jgi:N-acetylglucosamine-6-sulfatase
VTRAAVALLAACAAAAAGSASAGAQRSTTAGGVETRPNVVVVMTDDQALESMRVMPNVRALIEDEGVTFPHSLASFPLCCPSRATFLTGRYAHNHRVLDNEPPRGGYARLDSTRTLPVWLEDAGYRTVLIGKYLNGYEEHEDGVPPGWTEWHGTKLTYFFYGYVLLEAGRLVQYGSPDEDPESPLQPETYSTDVLTEKAVEVIRRRVPSRSPLFLWVSYLAPHSGFPNPQGRRCTDSAKPAARHFGAFTGEALPRPPSFAEADVSDKPTTIQRRGIFTDADVERIGEKYRCQLESLLAVDEGVRAIVEALDAAGELDNTLLIFTSDNGFFHGEHRIGVGKDQVYEEAIRVPLLMRGPGIPAGRTVSELAVNADLAPTILEAAGAEADLRIDGRSLWPLIANRGAERGREILIEGKSYEAIRTRRYVYARYTQGPNAGQEELYDLKLDPFELRSQHLNAAYIELKAHLRGRLNRLDDCDGGECRLRPRLRFAVRYRESPRGGCALAPVRTALTGPDVPLVQRLELFVNGDAYRTDRSAPFGGAVPTRLLDGGEANTVRGRASLLDGRRITFDREVDACGR